MLTILHSPTLIAWSVQRSTGATPDLGHGVSPLGRSLLQRCAELRLAYALIYSYKYFIQINHKSIRQQMHSALENFIHWVWVGLALKGHPGEWAPRMQGTQRTETWTPPSLQGWHCPCRSRSGVLSLIPRASHHKRESVCHGTDTGSRNRSLGSLLTRIKPFLLN